MSALAKAKLQEISSDEKGTPLSDAIDVQFNPTTLKLQISPNMESGAPSGSQVRQAHGSVNTTLTFDLIFDTADEGSTDAPRSVREKTALIERFVVAKVEGTKKQKPPKVRFSWGSLIVDGVIDSITIDIDHFAADGTPLRAKAGVSIKEQNAQYQFLKTGAGANQGGNVPSPLQAAAGALGSVGGGLGIGGSVALSIGGESAADFAVRVGLDASAWRGLSAGLASTLSLDAGIEIGFDATISANAGMGVTLGVEAGISTSLESSFGLEASTNLNAVAGVGSGANLAQGFALSAAGGVSAALGSVQIAKSKAAVAQTRQAFGVSAQTVAVVVPHSTVIARPVPPEQLRPPLARTGIPSPAQQLEAPASPPPPRVDPRAVSFGAGLPLRPTVGSAAGARTGSIQGSMALRSKVGSPSAPVATDPTIPPWIALPPKDPGRQAANAVQASRRPARPCGCLGPCRHRGGL